MLSLTSTNSLSLFNQDSIISPTSLGTSISLTGSLPLDYLVELSEFWFILWGWAWMIRDIYVIWEYDKVRCPFFLLVTTTQLYHTWDNKTIRLIFPAKVILRERNTFYLLAQLPSINCYRHWHVKIPREHLSSSNLLAFKALVIMSQANVMKSSPILYFFNIYFIQRSCLPLLLVIVYSTS